MKLDILRVNKSTAKRAHIILLLPFIMSLVSVKAALAAIVLGGIYSAIAYALYVLCKKHLSMIIAYPIAITVYGTLSLVMSVVPDFYGFSLASASVPAIFLALFLYKYIGAIKDTNKKKTLVFKYLIISAGSVAISLICEITSRGTIFDFKIHNHPIPYFATYSGIFAILAILCAIANITLGNKISINRSFNMKKGSIRLISYSGITAAVVISLFTAIDALNLDYLANVIVCFMCGLSFIAFRLIDKKIHIGKHTANLVPSLAFLLCLAVNNTAGDYVDMLKQLAITYLIFVCAVYICEILAMRSSITDTKNPFAGAPSTLILLSVAAIMVEKIAVVINI